MFWTLIATITAGLGSAGIALLIRKVSGQRAPKWIVPAFAGVGMLAFLVHGEYGWAELKKSQMPKEAIVVSELAVPVVWRPWTYAVPQINQLIVLDTSSLKVHPQHPEQRLMQLYRFEQGIPDSVVVRPHILNCDTGELLVLTAAGPDLASLNTLASGDALLEAACR